jgi:hypothetical protein
MGTRPDFQTLLAGLVEGVSVYFQPPPNVQMSYPAIVYNRDYQWVIRADNELHARMTRYQVTVIDPDPDSPIPETVAKLPMSTYVRHYTTENLNHDIYDVYF